MKSILILLPASVLLSRAYISPSRTGFFLKILVSALVGIFLVSRRMSSALARRRAETGGDGENEESAE
jgi:hypothetical protein